MVEYANSTDEMADKDIVWIKLSFFNYRDVNLVICFLGFFFFYYYYTIGMGLQETYIWRLLILVILAVKAKSAKI